MSWSLTLQAIETAALVIGVLFGLFQLRQIRIQREIQGGAELLRSLQSPRMARVALALYKLPDGLSRDALRERLGDDFDSVLDLMILFESLGPLIARGHLPIDIYADYYRGGTVICWRRLRRYVEEERADAWPSLMEWFQWLAEQMEEKLPQGKDTPAHVTFRNWRKPGDFRRLKRTG